MTPGLRDDPRIEAAWREALRPSPRDTHLEWAIAKYQPAASAIKGNFDPSFSPYLPGVFAALDDDATRDIIACFAAQLGKSTTGEVACGRAIECAPQPILWLSASDDTVELLSGNRIDPLLELPSIAPLIGTAERRASRTKKYVQFRGGWLRLGSAASIAPFIQDSYSLVILDEVDKYLKNVRGEGGPLQLARLRQRWFEDRGAKTLMISTPALATDNIWPAYQESDQRHFYVPCPACGHLQHLVWEQVKYKAPYSVHEPRYLCARAECGAAWDDRQRIAATRSAVARWIADKPFAGTAGFHLNSMYSGSVKLRDLVSQWIVAQKDPQALQTFLNGQLALPWHVQAESPLNPDTVPRHGWGAEVPQQAIALVAFADLQGAATKALDRIEVSTFGVDVDGTFYGISHDVLRREQPEDAEPYVQLDAFLAKRWRRTDGLEMMLDACAVDISHDMDQALDWIFGTAAKPRAHPANVQLTPRAIGSSTWLVGSWGDARGAIGTPMFPRGTDLKTGLPNPSDKKGRTYLQVNRSQAKHELYERLRREGPGGFRYPDLPCFNREYFAGLVAEAISTKTNSAGQDVEKWVKMQKRNEPLDCAAGCVSMYRALVQYMPMLAAKRPLGDPVSAAPAARAPQAPARPAPRVTVIRKKGMSFD